MFLVNIVKFLRTPALKNICERLLLKRTSNLKRNVLLILLVDFNAGKTQLVSFDRSNNTGAIDVKMDGSVLEQ